MYYHCLRLAREYDILYDGEKSLEVSQLFHEEGILADTLPEHLSDWASELLQNKRTFTIF